MNLGGPPFTLRIPENFAPPIKGVPRLINGYHLVVARQIVTPHLHQFPSTIKQIRSLIDRLTRNRHVVGIHNPVNKTNELPVANKRRLLIDYCT